jgi:hypothetical protein
MDPAEEERARRLQRDRAARRSASGGTSGPQIRSAAPVPVGPLCGPAPSPTGSGRHADTPSGTAPAATFTNSPVSNNKAVAGNGGGIYNGVRGTLTTTGVSGAPLVISGNSGFRGGGIAANNSTATTLTQTDVTVNQAGITAGGVYRHGGTMTTTDSPISATPRTTALEAPRRYPTALANTSQRPLRATQR